MVFPLLDNKLTSMNSAVNAMRKNETQNRASERKTAVMVVAYPGDETLFAGGQVLLTPNWRWHIVSVFSGSKPDVFNRFNDATARLHATGEILGIPERSGKQTSLQLETSAAIIRVLADHKPDILITHSPFGECRKLLGRDVLGRIVTRLWNEGATKVQKLWIFAYEDDNVEAIPMAADESDRSICLAKEVWQEKRGILINSYGFGADSFVARTCPLEEAFFCFSSPDALRAWRKNRLPPSRKVGMDSLLPVRGKASLIHGKARQ